jgi:hypothetical protein
LSVCFIAPASAFGNYFSSAVIKTHIRVSVYPRGGERIEEGVLEVDEAVAQAFVVVLLEQLGAVRRSLMAAFARSASDGIESLLLGVI